MPPKTPMSPSGVQAPRDGQAQKTLVPAVPELFEDDNHPAVDVRTETLHALRELGPPDLVHLVKQSTKSASKQVGVYHHVTGVDASSSASLAAYLNTLSYTSADKNYKITSGLYCCYNAFSRLDMRVQVTIPGSVESYCIDERGDKRVASESLWLETYLCSVLRSYSYADDGGGDAVKKIIGCRRFNPITSTEAEHKFLEAAERLFFNGWQLGSDPEIQVPNNVSNHLTTGLLSYITTTGRYASGINLFEKLRTREPEVASLLAKVYIAGDEEVKAVRLLGEAITKLPMDYSLLNTQAYFCNLKGRNDLALDLARRSVVSAPSEFSTWARLVEVYIALEQWELALLTLNSCPMFTYQDKDAPRVPQPDRIHLPPMPEAACEEIDDQAPASDIDPVHSSLRKLVGGTFKGTFQKAYVLLTEITKKIGWDQLLRIRSQVFVMEEEYRNERHVTTTNQNASTVALNGSPRKAEDEESAGGSGSGSGSEAPSEAGTEDGDQAEPVNGNTSRHRPTLSKPTNTVTNEAVHDKAEADAGAVDPSHSEYTSLRHKRLCERWLDNLFMVLYEDLRIFTVWRSDVASYKQQQMQYKKTHEEWEILGDLAQRLHYEREAVEAYQQCLNSRFNPKAMRSVMLAYQREGDTRNVIGTLIREIAWQYRWYSEFSPFLFQTIRKLIEDEGSVKVRSVIQATSLPQHVLDLTHQYGQLCAAFRSSGTEAGA